MKAICLIITGLLISVLSFSNDAELVPALQFDGVDDYAKLSNFTYPVNDLTIEAWINPAEFGVVREIVYGINPDNSSAIQFRIEGDGRLLYGENPDWAYVSTTDPCISLNEWNHVAMVRENGSCKLYVNGVQLAEGIVNEGVSPTNISIGGREATLDRIFSGNITDVRIWEIARSQSDIQAKMTSSLTGSENGLIANWQMNEGSGQTVSDISGNTYNLQLGSTTGSDTNDPVWILTDNPYNSVVIPIVNPLIQNEWTTFTWPYNAYLPENVDGINGHVGNACGYTSIARILQYWGFPSNGNGNLQFTDVFGNDWDCDLSNMNLDYSKMPLKLETNASQSEYDETAKLFLAAGAVGEKIKIWATGNEIYLPDAFIDYFNFSSSARIVNREDHTRQEWIDIFKNELDNGRPMVVVGRKIDSPAPGEPGSIEGHWWICDGYDSDDKFYSDYAYGDIKGWDDIDSLGGEYIAYNRAIIGLEPDFEGKTLNLISPNGGEKLTPNSEATISWSSTNVSTIKIEYSSNNGSSWNTITASVSAGTESYTWTIPDIFSINCKVKITDTDNNNIVDASENKFQIGVASGDDYFTNYDLFISKLNELTASTDNSAELNSFWNDLIATGNFPFVIDTKVAFLYRGSASSVNWAGMFNKWDLDADAGTRLGISDVWILEKEFILDTRCEYKIVKNGSEWLTDPNNPHPLVGDYGNSELWMPDYNKHTELILRPEIPKGTLSNNIIINSSHLGYSCQYRVYTPAGYNSLSGLSTIYVADGQNYLDESLGKMITVLDNLIADNIIDPIITIYLDPRDPNNLLNDRRGSEYRNNINFVNYITQELIPDIDAAYKTNSSADTRGIMGASYGGYNAEYFSVKASDYFHLIGMNSPYLHPEGAYDIDSDLNAANLDDLKLYLSYGTFDADGERYFNRLKDIFDLKGKEFESTIIGDDHTWQNWSRVIGDALEYFYAKSETGSLSLTYPNGGEYFLPDDLISISWEASSVSNLKIEYSSNNGADWNEITASVSASTGKYDWLVPNVLSEQCKIKISDVTNLSLSDESDNIFEIGDDLSGHLLQLVVNNSLNYYRTLKQNDQIPAYELVIIPEANWTDHSAKVMWDFEPGYFEGDKFYITEPHTAAQLEVFPTIESGIKYTVAKKMLLQYCATNAPEWFQFGYASYEAQLDRPYETIRDIYDANGEFPDLSEFDSFDPENDIEQRDLAFTMGEYCMLILGDYPRFPSFDANGITVLTGDQTAANGFWHLFLEKHYLESTDQVKLLVKNDKIAIYGASKDAPNAQVYLDTLSSQLQFYVDSFKVNTTHRLNVLINPDKCTQLLVEGYECTSPDGGGGHGSGLAGCAFVSPEFNSYRDFIWLMTHEFTHVYQFWIKSNFMPAWLSEGFASCLPYIKVDDGFVYLKDDMFNKWTIVRQNLERDPTISELMDYNFVRSNNIDYYGMGWLMVEYIIKRDGYLALRNLIESNGLDFTSMGFGNKDDFMEYYYHYFNIRIMEEEIVSLSTPNTSTDYTTSSIDFSWTALNQNIALDLEISLNSAADWSELLSNTDLSNYSWNVPSDFAGVFYLKYSAPDNLNISTIYGPFTVAGETSDDLILSYPNGGEYFTQGSTMIIKWNTSLTSDIKIEFSENNGSAWQEIVAGTSASSENYTWTVPDISSTQCLIKITDISNDTNFDESNGTFTIGEPGAIRPYTTDGNTVLLLHFDGNLKEEANDYTVSNQGITKSYIQSPVQGFGEAIHFDNSNQDNKSFITVPNSTELSMTNNWTIEFWFNIKSWDQSFNSWPVPILLPTEGWDSNYFLEIPSGEGRLKYGFKSNDGGAMVFSSQNSITTGTWYHIALINDYDNHNIRIIIRDTDFVELDEQSATYTAGTTISTGTQDLRIGNGTAGDNYFNGYIDELRISNIVRDFESIGIDEDHEDEKLFSMYPNPAEEKVYIESNELVELSIINMTGQKLIERKNFLNGEIDVSILCKGIYFVLCSNEKGFITKKLIIK